MATQRAAWYDTAATRRAFASAGGELLEQFGRSAARIVRCVPSLKLMRGAPQRRLKERALGGASD